MPALAIAFVSPVSTVSGAPSRNCSKPSRTPKAVILTFQFSPRQFRLSQLLPFPFSGPQSKSTTAIISQAKIGPATKTRYTTKYDRSPCTRVLVAIQHHTQA